MSKLPYHKIPLVREVMRRGVANVKANAAFYNQDTFGEKSHLNPCESECCLAGFIDWGENGAEDHMRNLEGGGIREAALKAMGLDTYAWIRPFEYSFTWPPKFSGAYKKAATRAARAEVLEARVEYWLRTGI